VTAASGGGAGRFEGKTVLISGAARGQGAEEARRFAAEGARVVLGDVLDEEGEAAAAAIGDAASYVHLDVTDESSWEAAVAACGGALHVLVNNAGILGTFTPLVKTELADFRKAIDVNLVGTFLGIKHGGAAIGDSGGGAIVNISSISGMWGTPFAGSYVSSKWAIRGLTKTAALELGRKGIRVNSIHPGGVKTPMTAAVGDDGENDWYARLPISRIGTVDDIAGAVLFLASDDAAYISGTELVIDGGTLAGDLSLLPPGR
jgi:3alpha(or 20beta)-hydroxysteroid dehydrogenase